MARDWKIFRTLIMVLLTALWGACLLAAPVPNGQVQVASDVVHTSEVGANSGTPTQDIEQWGRPVYAPFVAAFYLGVQIVATVGTVVFIFVVLLRQEEE
ncbi:MAG: hypothetical protein ONB07_04265 [candidate division KSB1 bacterium]|nr:hypothetical protein [candidate division KSB1 bacterium]MDZ7385317.1 hypothetical protein [candidate division KSB1 bacterium]MDZ7392761.1 hypothetical protein [candidate division KSB1 bacterium]MDZ7413902.1 hypothetical protein [candidate division KSB1 bacterium]